MRPPPLRLVQEESTNKRGENGLEICVDVVQGTFLERATVVLTRATDPKVDLAEYTNLVKTSHRHADSNQQLPFLEAVGCCHTGPGLPCYIYV